MISRIADSDLESVLTKAISIRALNHKYIANNIANVDTPGFKPQHVSFKDTLISSLRRTGKGLEARDVRFQKEPPWLKNDKNSVDIDYEMTHLAQNTQDYRLYVTLLAKRFSGFKSMLRSIR